MERYFSPEKVFLFFCIFVGLFMVFFIPPFQSQDEPNHFKRAYSVSVLKIFSIKKENMLGNNLPCAIQDFIDASSDTGKEVVYAQSGYKYSLSEFKKLLNIELDKNKQCFLNYPNIAIYSPLAYLPQSVGVLLASFLSSKILFMFLAGRIFNLLFFTLLCFYAIKTTPYLKWVFALVLSCPMCIALASSLSADAVLISCCALFFAKILEVLSFDATLQPKDIFLFVVLSIIIAMTKQSYWFLLFIFLIPKNKIQKNYVLFLSLVLVPSFILYFLWSIYASSIMVPLNGSDAGSHVDYILSQPWAFFVLVTKTIFNIDVLYQTIGVLGWKTIYLDNIYYLSFVVVLLANLFSVQTSKQNLAVWQKNICLFVTILNIVLICTTTFCFWTYRTNFQYIELQGRYLLPFVLPFLFFISSFVNGIFKRSFAVINTLFLAFSAMYLAGLVFRTFYFA